MTGREREMAKVKLNEREVRLICRYVEQAAWYRDQYDTMAGLFRKLEAAGFDTRQPPERLRPGVWASRG